MKPEKILFLLPYPLQTAPSQRFRMEVFLPLLKENNFGFTTQTFFDDRGWSILYKKGFFLEKIRAVFMGFARRWFVILFRIRKYDFVIVHREAAPIGPPVFEWLITKLWRKKMIYDFDDAIWIPAVSEGNRLATQLKCFWKIKWICKWAYKIAAGNDYLAEFARRFNPKVYVLPTGVETNNRYNCLINQNVQRPSIGWTGSHSTIKYLNIILPVLKKLESRFDFDFIVICNQKPQFKLQSLKYIEWSQVCEIEDLKRINIGLMPLETDEWSEGKCGFKIIQYLALGIPAVASPVGVNKTIIDKENGFLCSTEQEWYQALSQLISNCRLREEMGKQGRKKIVREYSTQAILTCFLELFDRMADADMVPG